MKLTPKQQRFVEEYLVDLNATQAAKRAGYSPRTAHKIGTENLHKPVIAAAIAEARAVVSERTQITVDRVLEEYAAIAFADISNYLRLEDNGMVYFDWSAMSEGATRAISEIVQEEYVDGAGENAPLVKKTRFKLHSKISALDSLAKHLNMFVDRQKVEISGSIEHRQVDSPPRPESYEDWIEQRMGHVYGEMAAVGSNGK